MYLAATVAGGEKKDSATFTAWASHFNNSHICCCGAGEYYPLCILEGVPFLTRSELDKKCSHSTGLPWQGSYSIKTLQIWRKDGTENIATVNSSFTSPWYHNWQKSNRSPSVSWRDMAGFGKPNQTLTDMRTRQRAIPGWGRNRRAFRGIRLNLVLPRTDPISWPPQGTQGSCVAHARLAQSEA